MHSKSLKTVTTINGRLVKRGQDKISVFDNTLLYAEGLFETLLAIDKQIVFLQEHLKRLYNGSKTLGLKIPVNPDRLSSWMKKTINAHPNRIIQLRLTVTSGEAARWVGIQGKPQVILSAAPHRIPTRPFKIYVSEFRVDQDSIFRRIKTTSYAIHAAALNQAKAKKCDDALLLNEKKQIAEVTSANIFWVKNNNIYTPPITSGCLDGITRKKVIKEAKKLGYKLLEKKGELENLINADEVFITSSLKLVIGVSQVKTKQKNYSIKTGPVTQTFIKRFKKIVNLI